MCLLSCQGHLGGSIPVLNSGSLRYLEFSLAPACILNEIIYPIGFPYIAFNDIR